jgi:flagellar hook protein FlgE
MRGFQTKLDVIGNNIANVNTVGFKASRVNFKDILSQTVAGVTPPMDPKGGVNAKQIGLGVTLGSIDTIHTPGSAMTTNVPTDLRIDGDGFFAVQEGGANGFYLTRDGSFKLDAAGNLVNGDGLLVLSTDGTPIKIDTTTVSAFTIGQDGSVLPKAADGTVLDAIAKIGVVKVTNPSGLEKVGGNLYRSTLNSDSTAPTIVAANDSTAGTGTIISGQLEMSNVDLTNEFTEMIVAQRGFQANSRIITTSDEILQEIVNLKH